MKKVILHIGHDKTATTSIQATFKYNLHILDDYGYDYPVLVSDNHHYRDGDNHHNRVFAILFNDDIEENDQHLATHKLNRSSLKEIRSKTLNLLSGELLTSNAHTFIFSGESLTHFNQSQLTAIKDFFYKTLGEVEFKVFAYTRDPATYASSFYQQRARRYPSDTKANYFSYEEIIGRYINIFGKESMNLYKFEDACKYPTGPVCFLLNKMGLQDEIVDQMQICNKNESISDMAVDLLTYINREIPFTTCNIKSSLRGTQDWKPFQYLPGKKFQLPEEDIVNIQEKTRSNIIWLKDNYNISYSFNPKSQNNIQLEFDGNYVEHMILALRKCKPVIRKLVYNYLLLRSSERDLSIKGKDNLLLLRAHFEANYFFTKQLSLSQICNSTRIANYLRRPIRFIYKRLIKRFF